MSVGPRSPALSESSVCGMRTPWLVVRNSPSGRAWYVVELLLLGQRVRRLSIAIWAVVRIGWHGWSP